MTEELKPSSTAVGAAVMRAIHVAFDGQPKVLDDTFAMSLVGIPNETALKGAQERLLGEFSRRTDAALAVGIVRYLRAAIVLRNRYAEDELAAAMARGVRQYVLLGAGLDSFALRRRDLADRLDVFELDLAATQAWKRQRLQALGVAQPPTLHFVPVDFERQSPMEALAASSFCKSEPAFFSWLGVTSYLTQQAIFETLRDLATAAPGSKVVFSYGLAESCVGEQGRRINAVLKADVAARGEAAASSGFVPAQLAQYLREIGYSEVRDLSVADADARYFRDRSDGLRAAPMTHLMVAGVGRDGADGER